MSESNQLTESRPQNVRQYLELPQYKARFGEVLGPGRAPQFMASLVTLSNDYSLAKCEPRSVIAAAMIAAVLDFPIEKSLGFAHIVPYGDKAQFQMAAKGYVQLALRSGQYHRLNAKPVNAEAFGGYDDVGEPKILWEYLDETKPIIGYAVAWKLANGFTKVAFWPRAKVEAHAAQFSQAYKRKKMDSPWFTNFDKMALKTVVMNELRAWGILSVQMHKAMVHDQAVHTDIDAEPQYIDGAEDVTGTATEETPTAARPAPPPRQKKGAAAIEKPTTAIEVETVPATTEAQVAQQVPPTVAEKKAAEDAKLAEDMKAREAKLKAAQPAQETKPAPEPTKTEAPKPAEVPAQRALLKDGEEITVVCTVVEATGMFAGLTDEKGNKRAAPTALVKLDGGYYGSAHHFDGAQGGDHTKDHVTPPTPLPIWKVGGKVKVTLLGKMSEKQKRVMVRVTKVESAEAALPEEF